MNIYDVAKESGVSIATVSRVLNSPEKVSEKTRNKVIQVLKKHSYTPNAIARGLVVNSMKTIGVLTIDIRDNYFANVAYTIEQEFSNLGYNVILCNTGGDTKEIIRYMKILSEKKVDGFILVGSVFKDKTVDRAVSTFSKTLPVVFVNGYNNSPNTFSIICDDTQGIRLCMDYLVGQGHRDIVFVRDSNTFSSQTKEKAFKSSMEKHGLELFDHSILNVKKGFEGGMEAVETLMEKGAGFTAIITGEDIVSIGAIKKLKQYGIRVPEDVSVTGYNNSILSNLSEPELTTIDNKMDNMGIGAVRILNDVLEGRSISSKTVITPDLVIRNSTGARKGRSIT